MNTFFKLFKKVGGWQRIKEYARARVLLYALFQMLLNGFSKKSLEIVRLGIYLKINKKLRKKYINELHRFDQTYSLKTNENVVNSKIWFCWLQGLENAPVLVQRCFTSINENIVNREIILITNENRKEYIKFPDFIEEKYAKGLITNTHFSDLLRVELLCQYGGTWIDATVFCSGTNIPDYMLNSEFFVFQNLKPGADGHVLNVSSWFMTSCSNQKLLLAVKAMLYAYWEKENRMVDYFLLHHFFSIVSHYYVDDWKKINQYPNSMPHVLLLSFFEPYNKEKYNALINVCPFHKLAYKCNKEDLEKVGTYYQHIMQICQKKTK